MGRVLADRMRLAALPAAVIGLCGSAALSARPLPAEPLPPQPVPAQPEPPRGAPAAANSGPVADPPPPGPGLRRYKIRFLANRRSDIETWLVFDVIEDTTLILWKQASTDGAHWWDHPLTSAQACRIHQAEAGDRLVDCVRSASPGHGEPLRLALPPGACRQDCLLTFTWEEGGRLEEGLIRLDRTQQPAATAPLRPGPTGSDPRDRRYRIKLSPGSATSNLQPESWVLVEVRDGTTITLKHSTNAVNLITGFSRWWDHPLLTARACPLFAAAGPSASEANGCLQGSSPGPGQPMTIRLPRGASLHDYRLSFSWRENGRIQQATTVIDRLQTSTPLPR